jgi:hypothetical protein
MCGRIPGTERARSSRSEGLGNGPVARHPEPRGYGDAAEATMARGSDLFAGFASIFGFTREGVQGVR